MDEKKDRQRYLIGIALGAIGITLAVASIGMYLCPGHWSCRHEKFFHMVVLALWLVVPPVWFMVEIRHFAKGWTRKEKVDLKETQELVTKVWAGIAGLLAVLNGLKG